jgi:hypothetical protein
MMANRLPSFRAHSELWGSGGRGCRAGTRDTDAGPRRERPRGDEHHHRRGGLPTGGFSISERTPSPSPRTSSTLPVPCRWATACSTSCPPTCSRSTAMRASEAPRGSWPSWRQPASRWEPTPLCGSSWPAARPPHRLRPAAVTNAPRTLGGTRGQAGDVSRLAVLRPVPGRGGRARGSARGHPAR